MSTLPTVLVLMGVSGCGKSTVAGLLAGRLGWDLAEGDDLHPPANVAKMSAGTPLTDADRWPWLAKCGAWIDEQQLAGRPGLLTCSALKKSYRDVLRRPGVVFVHLTGSYQALHDRLTARSDHFMPSSLLDSQLATLQPLEPDENGLVIDIEQTPKEIAAAVISRLSLTPADRDVELESSLTPETD